MSLELKSFRGGEAKKFIEDLARLRINVFSEWPYIYEGDIDYESKYLNQYFSSKNSFVALIFDATKVVGASTAIWLPDAEEEFRNPFYHKDFDLDAICYFGESVLERPYRGQGVGRKFFQARESFARSLNGVRHTSFCSVIRPAEHPLKDSSVKPLAPFWRSLGYAPLADMVASYRWKDLNDDVETPKELQFWLKRL